MKFLDRMEEMGRLDALAGRSGGGLGVLFGRRRVGKTRLAIEWNRKHRGIYTVADQSAPTVQRRYLSEAVAEHFDGFADAQFEDWRGFFRALAREAKHRDWRGPVILDEIPNLVAGSPELPSVLQHWLDHEAAEAGLVVLLSGSSQRMMQGLVMDASEPLYGRAVEAMRLAPIPLGYLAEELGIHDPVEAVRWHAVWGGLPRYWELAEPFSGDLDAAVDRCVLDPLGPLHAEPESLLRGEVPPAPALRPILDAIGAGAHRLTEIAGRIGQQATALNRPMGRLVGMGLVVREIPFGQPEKSGKRALYKIADPFCRFWFRVVAPHRALLAEAPAETRLSLWHKYRNSLFAAAWEELCRSWIALATESDPRLGRFGPWLPARRHWHGNDPEWDVVSRSLDGRHLLLGEAKWSDRPLSGKTIARYAAALRAKGLPSIPGCENCRPVHCLFVPRAAPDPDPGLPVIQAADILPALR